MHACTQVARTLGMEANDDVYMMAGKVSLQDCEASSRGAVELLTPPIPAACSTRRHAVRKPNRIGVVANMLQV